MDEGLLSWNPENRGPIDSCVGCRSCETACPSGVQYGSILGMAREKFENRHPRIQQTLLLNLITNPTLLRFAIRLGGIMPNRKMPTLFSRLISKEVQAVEIPRLPIRQTFPPFGDDELPKTKGVASIFKGCAMPILHPEVNVASERLLRRIGFQTNWISGCCGALHAHNGHLASAHRMATKAKEPKLIVSNSGGCGSWLKEAGFNLVDMTVFLHRNGLREILTRSASKKPIRVAYHDACHLLHGQGVKTEPRELIASIPGVEVVEIPEPEICCGSGGTYNIVQPNRAAELLDRKLSHINKLDIDIVVSGNPGCLSWLRQNPLASGRHIQVIHTLTFLEQILSGSF